MRIRLCLWRFLACIGLLFGSVSMLAEEVGEEYRCEIGLQLGGGYYVGDMHKHVFMEPLEVLGGQFRYKFDQRWALQVKAQRQRITFRNESRDTIFYNPLMHIDAVAEFNFFRFGYNVHDRRVKKITPFVSFGVGMTVFSADVSYKGNDKYLLSGQQPLLLQADSVGVGLYIPLGIGVKWKFHKRWQLQAAWQHQIYIVNGDGLEGVGYLDNSYDLNGVNILNNDYMSTLTIGVVYEFAREKKKCYFCE